MAHLVLRKSLRKKITRVRTKIVATLRSFKIRREVKERLRRKRLARNLRSQAIRRKVKSLLRKAKRIRKKSKRR